YVEYGQSLEVLEGRQRLVGERHLLQAQVSECGKSRQRAQTRVRDIAAADKQLVQLGKAFQTRQACVANRRVIQGQQTQLGLIAQVRHASVRDLLAAQDEGLQLFLRQSRYGTVRDRAGIE